MKKTKYSIIEDRFEEGLPTYFVLRSTYVLGFNLIGEIFGVDGNPDIPFQELSEAEEYKQKLENERRFKTQFRK